MFNLKTALYLMLSSYLMMGQTLTVSETQQVPISTSAASIETFIFDAFDTSINYKVSLLFGQCQWNVQRQYNHCGLTRDFGYTSWTNITSVNFLGTQSNIKNALNSITINTTAIENGEIILNVLITEQIANTYYNPTNGHLYKFVPNQIRIDDAISDASSSIIEGVNGYLVTITSADEQDFVNTKISASNVWIALSDRDQEGYYKWSKQQC